MENYTIFDIRLKKALLSLLIGLTLPFKSFSHLWYLSTFTLRVSDFYLTNTENWVNSAKSNDWFLRKLRKTKKGIILSKLWLRKVFKFLDKIRKENSFCNKSNFQTQVACNYDFRPSLDSLGSTDFFFFLHINISGFYTLCLREKPLRSILFYHYIGDAAHLFDSFSFSILLRWKPNWNKLSIKEKEK